METNVLSKKYRIIFNDKKMIFPFQEYPKGSTTYVGKGHKSFETDDYREAIKFIADNELAE